LFQIEFALVLHLFVLLALPVEMQSHGFAARLIPTCPPAHLTPDLAPSSCSPPLPQVQDPAEARPFLPLLMPLLDRLANEAADPELREVGSSV
jgi:hypothetical protein